MEKCKKMISRSVVVCLV